MRSLTSSLRKTALRCQLTVLGLRYNWAAMSRLVAPDAARLAMRDSLGVSDSGPFKA